MKILTTLLLTLFTVSFGQVKSKKFDFLRQVGVVNVYQNKICLTIPNANLAEGHRVKIIAPYKPQSVATAIIQRKLSSSCPRSDTGQDDSFYSLKLEHGKVAPEGVGIAIVGSTKDIQVVNGTASVDLNNDGRREYFRACTSSEGVHLTVWSGRPLRGIRQWHRYYYLEYGTVPNCTDKEAGF